MRMFDSQGIVPFRHTWVTTRLLWAVLAASILIPIALFGFAAWESRRQALREAERTAARIAQSIQQHAQNVFDTIPRDDGSDRRPARLHDGRGDASLSRELHDFLRRVDEGLAQIGTIVVTDADGLRISSSTEFNPEPTVNLADRDYIRA